FVAWRRKVAKLRKVSRQQFVARQQSVARLPKVGYALRRPPPHTLHGSGRDESVKRLVALGARGRLAVASRVGVSDVPDLVCGVSPAYGERAVAEVSDLAEIGTHPRHLDG